MNIISKNLKPILPPLKCLSLKNILLPLCFLGIVGFLINNQLTFFSTESLRNCRPRENIVFLKTHKCAGSSVQNIIMRFGDRKNLTFVLPPDGNYLGHPMPFSSQLLPTAPPDLPFYNILAHHTRLDHDEIMSVMPSDTVFLTIVRDPATVFESSFVYYDLRKFFGRSLHRFIRLIPKMEPKSLSGRYNGKFGINQMMFDLGADPAIFNNNTLVKQYVRKLDSWFHLVMVAERMDESLILLKHLMCWDTNDVVVFKVNARNPKYKSILSKDEISTLRTLNSADQILYNHFSAKFDGLVKDFGLERMKSEVSLLRQKTRDWYQFCVKGEEPLTTPRSKSSTKHYYNSKIMVFEPRLDVYNETCKSLTVEELSYTDYLRQKQKFFYNVQSSVEKQTIYNSS